MTGAGFDWPAALLGFIAGWSACGLLTLLYNLPPGGRRNRGGEP